MPAVDRKANSDRVALVTGASGGIGGAVARALAASGACVHALSRRRPERPAGEHWRQVDLADDASVLDCAEALSKANSGIDVLVHAAGVYKAGTVAEAPIADLDLMWRVNARTPWILTQKLLPALAMRKGWVVFVNSSIWENARANLGGYAASKFALKAMADALRSEVNSRGIRVLSVFPGRTAGQMQEAIHQGEGRAYRAGILSQPEDVARAIIEVLALPRTTEVTDIHLRPGLPPS